MNCSVCSSPLDHDMQLCLKCGTKVNEGTGLNSQAATPPAVPKKKGKPVGCINALVVAGVFAIPALTIIDAGLFPVISNAMLQANAAAVGQRGREIYIGIVTANTGREPLGEGLVWPKTPLPEGVASEKINLFTKGFKTSTDYFKALADEENYGTDKWESVIPGFDYTKLAGGGVPPCENHRLTAANNMWAIAANMTDADNEEIPVIITRNVDVKAIERVVNHGLTSRDFNTQIDLGKGAYRAPFASVLGVFVRKNGAIIRMRPRQATLGELFGNKEFPPRDPSKPPIVYLMP
jgi:hypothetical protein